MKKKILCLILAFALAFGLVPTAAAADAEATQAAQTLYELGLFRGTGTNPDGTPIFDLDKTPTRDQAVIMLVRLLGKGQEALNGTWTLPFTDVPKSSYAYPYIGYAYANGLTNGTTPSTYSGSQLIRANQYITFVLRALGYVSGEDFQYPTAWEFSDRIGLTDGRYHAAAGAFLRSDIARISERALSTNLKGSNVMLLRKLYNQKSAAAWAATAKTKQVSELGLPAAIGKTTLTYGQAYALLGKDPAVIAEAVKTVGDVVQYMIAANFGGHTPGTFTPWYRSGGEEWGFDPPGEEQLRQNYGTCCAGYVNMALYLLRGDYDEQGVIRWLGGGNHTIAYVCTGGKYYVFDPTKYRGGGSGPVTVLDRLEDYYDHMPSVYPKAQITTLVALRDTPVCEPSCGQWDKGALVFPTGARDRILTLYQKSPSAGVTVQDVTMDIPLWNTPRLDIPATNTAYDTYEGLKEAYRDVDLALLFGGGLLVRENHQVQVSRGTWTVTVLADGSPTSDFTGKSSDPTVCRVDAAGDGRLTLTAEAFGTCTVTLTHRGQTAEYSLRVIP